MSGDIKYPADQLRPLAEKVVAALADLCERIEIAGSLRRGKPMIGDVEIVVQPKRPATLLARLDTWVALNKVHKAVYSDNSRRWGPKYRGLVFPGYPAKVEIFLADADNWGWQLALRTGAADANAFMMTQCQRYDSPFRSVEGYWQIEGVGRITVPDERELFRLWGSKEVIPPQERTVELYQRVFRKPQWARQYTFVQPEETMTQEGLF